MMMRNITTMMLLKFFLFYSSILLQTVDAARFAVSGPIITVTLKDDTTTTTSSASSSSSSSFQPASSTSSGDMVAVDSSSSSSSTTSNTKKWVDIAGLNPNLLVSVQSLSAPLPNWLPSLTSMRANIGYRYNELRRVPSFIEGALRFVGTPSKLLGQCEVQLQPSYEFQTDKKNFLFQASKGMSYILARFSNNNKLKRRMAASSASASSSSTSGSSGDFSSTSGKSLLTSGEFLDYIRASYHINLPYASLSSIRMTPAYDFDKQEPTCNLEIVTGGSGRTKAVLNLEYNNPTLSVVHTLDDRNVIAPEISLYTARIIYHWNVLLGEGSSIRTKVDPTSAIHVTWMDKSMSQNGRWVTDFKLPLEGTTIQALAADIKVRRQFNF